MTSDSPPGIEGRDGTGSPFGRALEVDRTKFRELVEEAFRAGASVWIRATGTSNEPSIPANATVRLCPRTGRVRVGDVVLVLRPGSRPLLHRVRWILGSRINTIGDARQASDPVVTLDDIAGFVDVVEMDGEMRPLRRGLWTALLLELRRLGRSFKIAVWRIARWGGWRS